MRFLRGFPSHEYLKMARMSRSVNNDNFEATSDKVAKMTMYDLIIDAISIAQGFFHEVIQEVRLGYVNMGIT